MRQRSNRTIPIGRRRVGVEEGICVESVLVGSNSGIQGWGDGIWTLGIKNIYTNTRTLDLDAQKTSRQHQNTKISHVLR